MILLLLSIYMKHIKKRIEVEEIELTHICSKQKGCTVRMSEVQSRKSTTKKEIEIICQV